MTSEAHELLQHALALPPGERAGVAAVLLASLDGPVEDDPESVDQAWANELAARARRVMDGATDPTPWQDVRDNVATRLSDR